MPNSEITLVLNGEPKAEIMAPSDGPLAYAASELQRYVQQMSNAKLPITTGETGVAAEGTGAAGVIFRVTLGVVKHDGYSIRVESNAVVVEASEPRGCIYGAYALLEQLGCRFYGPEPLFVVVPKSNTLTLPATISILREPAFINHIPSGGTPEEHVRWGCNFTHVTRDPEGERSVRRLGLRQMQWGHIWPVLTSMQYFADGRSPERMDYAGREDWLPADENGVRRYNPANFRPWEGGQSLCFSNRQAFEWFTDNAVNWVLTYCRNADYVSMWSADTLQIAVCQCPRCRAQYSTGEYQYPTDWYLLIHNTIRRKLNELGWRNIFGWIVYHGSEEPPIHTNLFENGKNMDFLYAPRPRGGTQYGSFTDEHPVNARYRKNLQSWLDYLKEQKYQGTRTVFEYYYDLVLLGNLAAGRTFLIPQDDVMQEDMRFYHQQGFDGFYDCNPPSNTWFPDPLFRWLYHRLLWDLNLDLKAARTDFFQHYYGPAADVMQLVRGAVEQLMFEDPTPQVIDALQALETRVENVIAEARSDDVLTKRIEGMRLWVRYCALCKESELHEKVEHDKEKGKATEQAIRKLLNDNKGFLVSNGFMSVNDVAYVAGEVVERHLQLFEVIDQPR